MDDDDAPPGYAELWLAELGAWVPEEHDGQALAPRETRFGLSLPAHERARRHGARLASEPSLARIHRAARRA